MPQISHDLMNAEVAENHDKKFVRYARSQLIGKYVPTFEPDDACQKSYLRIYGKIGSKLYIRPSKCGVIREKVDTNFINPYPLTLHVCREIRFVIMEEIERNQRRPPQYPSSGNVAFELKTTQQASTEDATLNMEIEERLNRLSEIEREVLRLRQESRSYEDISELLSISVQRVKTIEIEATRKFLED